MKDVKFIGIYDKERDALLAIKEVSTDNTTFTIAEAPYFGENIVINNVNELLILKKDYEELKSDYNNVVDECLRDSYIYFVLLCIFLLFIVWLLHCLL